MTIQNLNKVIIIVFISCLLVLPAYAARLYFDIPQREFGVGEIVPVKIFIDTESEEINTVSLKLNYPQEVLYLDNVNNRNSIINFWVNALVGVVVGGYNGKAGLISQLNFKALESGAAQIGFDKKTEAYLNDGLGTPVKLDLGDIGNINIGTGIVVTTPVPTDKDPPEDFTPIIAQSPDVFGGQYFLVFSTQDKGSGIDHYEVQETRQDKPSPTNWQRVASPYLLTNQQLTHYIFVKAIDGAGNERVVGIRPKAAEAKKLHISLWLWLLIILLIALIIFAIIILIGRKKQREIREVDNNLNK